MPRCLRPLVSMACALAMLCGLASVAIAEECAPQSAAFFEASEGVGKAIAIIDANRVDWASLIIETDDKRAAYAKVKIALDALLPALADYVAAAEAASGAKILCDLGETVERKGVFLMEKATFTAHQLLLRGQDYLVAVSVAQQLSSPTAN